jgi:hypothetical protein
MAAPPKTGKDLFKRYPIPTRHRGQLVQLFEAGDGVPSTVTFGGSRKGDGPGENGY